VPHVRHDRSVQTPLRALWNQHPSLGHAHAQGGVEVGADGALQRGPLTLGPLTAERAPLQRAAQASDSVRVVHRLLHLEEQGPDLPRGVFCVRDLRGGRDCQLGWYELECAGYLRSSLRSDAVLFPAAGVQPHRQQQRTRDPPPGDELVAVICDCPSHVRKLYLEQLFPDVCSQPEHATMGLLADAYDILFLSQPAGVFTTDLHHRHIGTDGLDYQQCDLDLCHDTQPVYHGVDTVHYVRVGRDHCDDRGSDVDHSEGAAGQEQEQQEEGWTSPHWSWNQQEMKLNISLVKGID